ncbi:hypothetical protein FJ425_05315 [Mesorhizobium sp. B2-7-2]|nr:hypothetical protein FJ425_05315 [Mesorhizobium sp. B2-7-2]TPJ79192.1 hypothetical protein FJ419_11925 [Mesorhizobium sp. B2-6-2]
MFSCNDRPDVDRLCANLGTKGLGTVVCRGLLIPPDHPLLPSDLHQAPEPDRVRLLAGRVE